MFPETARRLKMVFCRVSAHGGAAGRLQARRRFGVSGCLTAKVPPAPRPRERVEIPGLETVTYGERMHYVPGLAKPVYPGWERDYKDPRYYKSPPTHEMPLYKEKQCYVYNQRTNALEGNITAAQHLHIITHITHYGLVALLHFDVLHVLLGGLLTHRIDQNIPQFLKELNHVFITDDHEVNKLSAFLICIWLHLLLFSHLRQNEVKLQITA